MSLIDDLKKQATVRVRSHGAFGENESYTEIDCDKLIALVAAECAKIAQEYPCYSNTDHFHIAEEINSVFGQN